MLRDAFDEGLSLDIGPVRAIRAMRFDGLGGVLPEGECRSGTLF